jgi:hypothetical protein
MAGAAEANAVIARISPGILAAVRRFSLCALCAKANCRKYAEN